MAINLFGVTPESVRAHHFPNADAWTDSSRPSETAVEEAVDEEAATVAGALSGENIDAESITTNSIAYLSCRKQLRRLVAVRIARDMTGTDVQLATTWATEASNWFEGLSKEGATFLGEGATATGTSDPDGPTSHISEYGLTVDVATDMSSAVPLLRKKDRL